jgi:L-malate glycosyltransferase
VRLIPEIAEPWTARVAIVAPPVASYYGGQEIQAHDLVALWENDPLVVVTFVSNRPDFHLSWTSLNKVRYLRTILRFPVYLANLCQAAHRANILHVFAASYGSFLIATAPAATIGRLLGKKVLIHYHSGRAEDYLRRSILARRVLRGADLVVVPSSFLVEVFSRNGIKSIVIPNVVDPLRFQYRRRELFGPRILCTRNFEQHYGVDMVLKAFSIVQQKYPDAHLSLVGSGTMANQLRELTRSLNLGNVEFKGAIPPGKMPDVYDQHDVFINGSRADCSPVSILESFCCGLPVVTTAAGGISTLVSHEQNGLLSTPGDHEALAANVLRVLGDPPLARGLAERARTTVEAHTWQNLRARWLHAYESLSQEP